MLNRKSIRQYRPHIHFVIAVGFAVSYLSGENDIETLHFYSGYALIVFFTFRLLWDITDHGMRILSWRALRETLLSNAKITYKFQRLSSFIISLMLPMLLLSGLVFNGSYNEEGPLFFLGELASNQFIDIAEDTHELLSKILLILVLLHVPMGFKYLKVTKFYRIYRFK